MNDLISRQDAIDVFGDVNPLDHNANAYREKIKNLPSVGKAANTITIELKPEQIKKCVENAIADIVPFEQQWIPCSERLPDIHEEVLTCDSDGMQRVYTLIRISDDEVGWEDDYGFYQSLEDVQAWMPLPKPYKGERNDN